MSDEAREPTPGEWKLRKGYGLLMAEIGPDDRAVATVWVKKMGQVDDKSVPVAWPEGEANARLLLASKDMRHALTVLTQAIDDDREGRPMSMRLMSVDRAMGIARKAIAKTLPRGGLCPGCDDPDCLGSGHPELCKESSHA